MISAVLICFIIPPSKFDVCANYVGKDIKRINLWQPARHLEYCSSFIRLLRLILTVNPLIEAGSQIQAGSPIEGGEGGMRTLFK